MNRTVQQWFGEPDFAKLPTVDKERLISRYFDQDLADERFRELPDNEQAAIRTEFVDANIAPHRAPAPDRGVLADVGASVARGAVGVAEMGARALAAVDTLGGEEAPIMAEAARDIAGFREDVLPVSRQARTDPVRKAWTGGVESAVTSLGVAAPTVALGAATGGAAGAALGYIMGAPLFGLAQYQQSYDEYVKKGVPKDEAQHAALLMGASEAGFEFFTDALELATVGMGGVLTKPAKAAAKDGIKRLISSSWSEAAKRGLAVTGTETAGELVNVGTQAEIEHTYKVGDERFWGAVKENFGQIGVASLIFGAVGGGVHKLRTGQVRDALMDPDAGAEDRFSAVGAVADELGRVDKGLAERWREGALQAVLQGRAISEDIEESRLEAAPTEEKAPPIGATGEDVTAQAKAPERKKTDIRKLLTGRSAPMRQASVVAVEEAAAAEALPQAETAQKTETLPVEAAAPWLAGATALEAQGSTISPSPMQGQAPPVSAAEVVQPQAAEAVKTDTAEKKEPWQMTPREFRKGHPDALKVPAKSILALDPQNIDYAQVKDRSNKEIEQLAIVMGIPKSGTKEERARRIARSIDIRRRISDDTIESLAEREHADSLREIARTIGENVSMPNKHAQAAVIIKWRDAARFKGQERLARANHYVRVLNALREDKPVPQEVLDEYPGITDSLQQERDQSEKPRTDAVATLTGRPRVIPESYISQDEQAFQEDARTKTGGWYIAADDKPQWVSAPITIEKVSGWRGPYSRKEIESLIGKEEVAEVAAATLPGKPIPQGDILNKDGQPYKNANAARFARRGKKLEGSHDVAAVEGGFVLRPRAGEGLEGEAARESVPAAAIPEKHKTRAVETLTGKKAVPAAEAKSEEQIPIAHDYSSTQVDMPADVADSIRDFAREIPDEDLYVDPADTDGYGREEKPHVTVRYGLATDSPENLRKAFKGFGPIKATLGDVSIFAGEKYDVVKADVTSPDLDRANRLVGETEKAPGETHKDYKPHVTIAYVMPGKGKEYAGDKRFSGQEITLDRLDLSDRNGKFHAIKLSAKPKTDATATLTGKKTLEKPPESVIIEQTSPPTKEVADESFEPEGSEPGRVLEPGDREPAKRSDVRSAADLAAGQPAAAGEEPVREIPGEAEGGAAAQPASGEPGAGAAAATGNRPHRGGRTGARPDRGAGGRTGALLESPEAAAGKRAGEDTRRPVELAPEDRNHVIAPDDELIAPGDEGKIKANIKAIELVNRLYAENRNPSPEEKKVLAQYVGWGAFAQKIFNEEYTRPLDDFAAGRRTPERTFWQTGTLDKFNTWKSKYGKKLHPALGGALTQEEWDAARASTLNAHYTDRDVITRMWAMVARLGFKGGAVLEPAAGVGHFIGMMPETLAEKSRVNAVELDAITGKILTKLYPQARVQISGFEKARGLGDNTQDLVISNFPFGKFSVFDPKRKQYEKWSIHNYFFGRSLDAVRPGGLVVAITSHFTLDAATNGEIRAELAKKADFVGGIRLPNNAFKKNAGTEVVTDILVFRKKDASSYGLAQDFRVAEEIAIGKDGKAFVNEYFVKHPEMVLGKHSTQGTMYSDNEYTVEPLGDRNDFNLQLIHAVGRFPENIMGEGQAAEAAAGPVKYAERGDPDGALIERDGEIYMVTEGKLVAPTLIDSKGKEVAALASASRKARAAQYLKIKSAHKTLIERSNTHEATDAELATLRAELNRSYDEYVRLYGYIGDTSNSFLKKIDIEFPVVDSLENEEVAIVADTVKSGKNKGQPTNRKVKTFTKSDTFTKRTIYPFVEPTTAENIEDAVSLSEVYRAGMDTGYIAQLIGRDETDVRTELVTKGLAFLNPQTGLLEAPDAYLSGNVKKKLKAAQAAAEDNPEYAGNVKALEAVQPAAVDIEFIHFKLGSPWLPAESIQDFLKETMGVDARAAFSKNNEMSRWHMEVTNGEYAALNRETWGAGGMSGSDLVADALNLKRPQVTYTEIDDGVRRTVKDVEATEAAQAKQEEIQEEFLRWARAHERWKKDLAEIYNEEKNGHVLRAQTNPRIEHFPGANPQIKLRPLQKRFVARGLRESTIFSYGVGTGKTYSFISLAMEMRRVGTAKKPLIVVQNSTIGQYRKAFNRLYPGARVLIPDEKQRAARYRQRLLSQMATGDWDAIVMPHSFFDGIADDPEREAAFIREQIDMINTALAEAEDEGADHWTVKDLEALKQRKETRLEKALDRRKDKAIPFEQMGIDALLVDEAHAYKRSEFFTKMAKVKGIDSGASQRSTSLFLKARYVQGKTGGKNVILATGTPISNTTAELWTIVRYVRPDLLEDYGIELFDDFAATFGRTQTALEETETGTYREVERFNKYVNGLELLTMWRTAADVQLTRDAGLKLPDIAGGKPEFVTVERTPQLNRFIDQIRAAREQWDHLSGKEKMKNRHVPLVLFGLAKKAAVDMRLVNARNDDHPDSKLNQVVKNVFEVWKGTAGNRSTQVVFLDSYRDSTGRFNAYEDIRAKLIEQGIPKEEVAVVTDAKGDAAREALFDRVRSGAVRVVIGSSQKLGVGVNMQDLLYAAHHVDVPPRPMDIEQRNGRIVREGNSNPKVRIYNYGVRATLDSVMYDRLTKKQRFIDQMLVGDIEGREFDDPLSEEQASLAEMMAAFSGNPLVFEKTDVDLKVKKLRRARLRWEHEVSMARRQAGELEGDRIPNWETALKEEKDQTAELERTIPGGKLAEFVVRGKPADRKALNEALVAFETTEQKKLPTTMTTAEWADYKENRPVMHFNFTAHRHNVQVGIRPVYTNKNGYSNIDQRKKELIAYDKLHEINEYKLSGFDIAVGFGRKGEDFLIKRAVNKMGGLLSSLENEIARINERPANTEKHIEQMRKDLGEFKKIATRPFGQAAELKEAEERLHAIEEELKKIPSQVSKEAGEGNALDGLLSMTKVDTEGEGPAETPEAEEAAAEIPAAGAGEEEYAIEPGKKIAGNDIPLEDVQAVFPGQKITQDDGGIWITTMAGRQLYVHSVEHVSVDQATVDAYFGTKQPAGEYKAAGAYVRRRGVVRLVRGAGTNAWVLQHEAVHWMEDAGILAKDDIVALRNKIRQEAAAGRWEPKNPKDIGGKEDRANWIRQELADRKEHRGSLKRILDTVADFLDAIVNLFKVTARGVVREIESGRVYERRGEGTLAAERAAGPGYREAGALRAREESRLEAAPTKAGEEEYDIVTDVLPAAVAERYRASKIERTKLLETIKEKTKLAVATFTPGRMFPKMPNARFGRENVLLREFMEAGDYGKARAIMELKDILEPKNMTAAEHDLFGLKLVLDDLTRDMEPGGVLESWREIVDAEGEIAFGFKSKDEVDAAIAKVDAAMVARPKVRDALNRRQAVMGKLRQALVNAQMLPESVLDDDRYFHHQVLEYANAKHAAGVEAGEVRVRKAGWQYARTGSIKDYNTKYIESEFQVLAQGYERLARKKVLDDIGRSANVISQLRNVARRQNKAAFKAMLKSDPQLKQQYEALDPTEKGAFRKQALGRRYVTWRNTMKQLAPRAGSTGWAEWVPRPGTAWYMTNSINDQILGEVLAGNRQLESGDTRPVLARGADVRWVIPAELAEVMDGADFQSKGKDNVVSGLAENTLNMWKRWILINPLRVVKYNLNNLSGDLDIALAYDPRILKHAGRAMRDLWAYHYDKSMSPELKAEFKAALQHGVIGGITAHDIPDVGKLPEFRQLERAMGARDNVAIDLIARFWHGSKNFTSWRENVLRLAAFRYFKERVAAGERVYGASLPSKVDAIANDEIDRKAGLLSRELVGDYGGLSKGGRWLRRKLIPFYSWQEINAPRYWRMMRNIAVEGEPAGRRVALMGAVAGKKAAFLGAKAFMIYGAVALWNALMFPDEEDELGEEGRRQMHLILGRRSDGSIISLRLQGALSDALSWFNLHDFPEDMKDLATGKKTVYRWLGEAAAEPANKLIQGMRPDIKGGAELISGRTVYPEFWRPRPIRDKGEYVARMLSLESFYRRVVGRPMKGGDLAGQVWDDIMRTFSYSANPGETAYYGARELVSRFLEDRNIERPFHEPTDRGNALYWYKTALKYGDAEAAARYLKKYKELGGNMKGLKMSVDRANPLAALPKKYRTKFYNSLSSEDRETVKRAGKWYKEAYKRRTP